MTTTGESNRPDATLLGFGVALVTIGAFGVGWPYGLMAVGTVVVLGVAIPKIIDWLRA